MNSNSKKYLIIASVIAGVLIAALLVYYFVFVTNDNPGRENKSDNSTSQASYELGGEATYKSEMTNKIINENQVDSNTNEQIAAEMQGFVDLLENVSISNVKVYQHNPEIIALTGNQVSTNFEETGINNQNINQNDSGSAVPSAPGQANNIDVVLNLNINPESKNADEINREMETTSNYLSESIAQKMPDINVLVINYYVNKSDNIRAEFTYIRSGSNLFLQEFTIS